MLDRTVLNQFNYLVVCCKVINLNTNTIIYDSIKDNAQITDIKSNTSIEVSDEYISTLIEQSDCPQETNDLRSAIQTSHVTF